MAKTISIFGLGKLGASMAGAFASKGFRVTGVDINQEAVRALNQGLVPVTEPGLPELIRAHRNNLKATLSPEEAIRDSEISFVIVPTPSDHDGSFSLQYAKHAFRGIGQALRAKQAYHTVVMTSTVLPGATRYGLLPILERESGKQCGRDFGLCYNPEFIALGSVLRDFLNPDFYLLGQLDEKSGDMLEAVHQRVSENRAPVKRMSLENAELAKIAVNSFVTMKISFANLMAELCEKLPGGDVDVVSDALGMDRRIGRKYLTGGLGFGGPCFPRDNVALEFMGRMLGLDARLLRANHEYNRELAPRISEKILTLLPAGSTVAVLGLAYKPHTPVVEESPGVAICRALSDRGFRVVGHDPLAVGEAAGILRYHAALTSDLAEALQDADAMVVTTPDPAYLGLSPALLTERDKPLLVLDPWRCLSTSLREDTRIRYVALGRGLPDLEENVLRRKWAQG
jgi:UDPglucose 6-dehydrogenase